MRFAALLVLAVSTLVSPALAQESKPALVANLWRGFGPWAVWVVRSQHYCYLSSQASGPEIYVGYNKSHQLGMGLTHQAWRSLEVGKTYPMIVQIDDRQHPGVMNSWMRPNGASVVLGRDFEDEEQGRRFLQDFQRGSQLTVIYEGRRLASYVLSGTQVAGDELLRCQAAQDQAKDNDPFKRKPADAPAPDKPAPSTAAGAAQTLPALTPEQRVEAIRLAANLLTRMPGFRILNDEEQKALDPKVMALKAAVVWRTEGAFGLLHMFPGVTEDAVPRIAGALIGGLGQECNTAFKAEMAPDVRSASVRRVHTSCISGASGSVMRVILMPFKGGVYYLSTAGEFKDNAAVIRAEELLRNALFEVVQK
ncbi:MAG: hypothetical protein AB7O88_26030 [Reyranellaceae bacterium]